MNDARRPVVAVAVHDGFYGCGTGAGHSNRAFLTILADLLDPSVHQAILPIRLVPASSDYDTAWHNHSLGLAANARADVLPVDNGTCGLSRFGPLDTFRA